MTVPDRNGVIAFLDDLTTYYAGCFNSDNTLLAPYVITPIVEDTLYVISWAGSSAMPSNCAAQENSQLTITVAKTYHIHWMVSASTSGTGGRVIGSRLAINSVGVGPVLFDGSDGTIIGSSTGHFIANLQIGDVLSCMVGNFSTTTNLEVHGVSIMINNV